MYTHQFVYHYFVMFCCVIVELNTHFRNMVFIRFFVLSVQLVKSIWKEVQCMSFSGGIYSLQNLSVYTMFISHFAMPIFSIFSSFFSVYAFSIYEYEIFPSWIFSNFIFALTTKNQEAWWSPKMEKERLMFIEWGFRRWIQLAAKYNRNWAK